MSRERRRPRFESRLNVLQLFEQLVGRKFFRSAGKRVLDLAQEVEALGGEHSEHALGKPAYAVTAYTVAQRTQEIGLRMALGARGAQVVGLFVGQAMRPLTLGVLAGLGGAFVAGRLLQTWLVKPATVDPVTLLIVAVLLVLIGLTAAVWPSWRASRVDPGAALRAE